MELIIRFRTIPIHNLYRTLFAAAPPCVAPKANFQLITFHCLICMKQWRFWNCIAWITSAKFSLA